MGMIGISSSCQLVLIKYQMNGKKEIGQRQALVLLKNCSLSSASSHRKFGAWL
jgi:hypothetical protein